MARKKESSGLSWVIQVAIAAAVTAVVGYYVNKYISGDSSAAPANSEQEIPSNQVRAGQGKG